MHHLICIFLALHCFSCFVVCTLLTDEDVINEINILQNACCSVQFSVLYELTKINEQQAFYLSQHC